jgi:hypothetical protein
MEWLASRIHRVFETEGGPLLGDPWAARDRYGPDRAADTEDPRALELLELERQALRLFTSCGWFFDDLARVEPIQVLRYAARALELVGPGREELEEEFLSLLETAVSNEDPPRTGREIYLQEVKPKHPAHLRVAAGAALWEGITGGLATGGEANRPEELDGAPGVPGYQVSKDTADTFLVTHRSTGRAWRVAATIGRPSADLGTVAVREAGVDGPPVWLSLRDVPEGFRLPIVDALSARIPDPGQTLTAAVEELCHGSLSGDSSSAEGAGPDPTEIQVERVRDLADLQILLGRPIPFDAQTTFFRFLETADQEAARKVESLRVPLGFTPSP